MMWNLHLRVEDKHIIRDPDGMLTDAIMHAANKLLAVQFPHLQGLQTTLLSKNFLQSNSRINWTIDWNCSTCS